MGQRGSRACYISDSSHDHHVGVDYCPRPEEQQEVTAWIAVIVAIVAVIVSIISIVLQTTSTSRALNRSTRANELSAGANELTALTAVLALENAMKDARGEVSDASTLHISKPDELSRLRLDQKVESYLNLVERFCACIRWGFVDEALFRADYRTIVGDVFENNPTETLVRYRHIRHVYDAWQNDRSAVEQRQITRQLRESPPQLHQ